MVINSAVSENFKIIRSYLDRGKPFECSIFYQQLEKEPRKVNLMRKILGKTLEELDEDRYKRQEEA